MNRKFPWQGDGGGFGRGRGGRGNWGYQRGRAHPPELRGKAIGLFYRDRVKANKSKPKSNAVKFAIPPAVMTRIRKLLTEITKIAERNNIIITTPLKSENLISESTVSEIKVENVDVKKEMDVTEFPFNADFVSLSNDNNTLTFKEPQLPPDRSPFNLPASSSKMDDFIPIKQEPVEFGSSGRQLSLRGAGDFKYGYHDIITGSFDEKLDQSLAAGIPINQKTGPVQELNEALLEEYSNMLNKNKYSEMLEFRKKLPAYQKFGDVLEQVENNQVVVISGETGCGKSTQVPQIILDNAMVNGRGANVRILVTQPRKIAASSLAERVASERAENLGHSVGYVVRLEKVDVRDRGSITFCTTGILLTELEVNQGLTKYSHVILDEVHERDVHVDLSMCMLKQILKKRKDLKLILMSATLDSERLCAYFDDCPRLHIEGLAYPVTDVYLEDILKMTKYELPPNQNLPKNKDKFPGGHNRGRGGHRVNSQVVNSMEKEYCHRAEVGPWLESVKSTLDHDVYKTLLDYRCEDLRLDLIVKLLIHICKGEQGAILVFLPGMADITKLLTLMEESNNFPSSRFDIYPLHSKLPSFEQRKIFETPPLGMRKIIVATNIAETSITIDDVVYVVDCGKLKITGINVEDNVQTLSTVWVSQANLRQRRGRAGRCQPGICYHLLTSYRASKLDERILPELQRSNLLEPVLTIKRLRLGNAEEALNMCMDPPVASIVKWAVNHLQQIGALDLSEILTPLGWHIARLPLHPAAGKLVLLGSLFGCLDRAASVAAVWAYKDPFMMVIGKEKEVDRKKRELARHEASDHIAISEAVITWEQSGRNKRSFAYEYFLSNNTLEFISEMKGQIADNLRQMGFLNSGNIRSGWENRNRDNLSLFKAIVAASLYPNIGTVKWININSPKAHKKIRIVPRTPEDGRVEIHPCSVLGSWNPDGLAWLHNPGANWLVYALKQRTTKLYLLDVTLVYTLPLLFFGEMKMSAVEGDQDDCHMTVKSLKVRCQRDTADLLLQLMSLLDQVLAAKVMVSSDYCVKHSDFDEHVLNAVIELITAEDEQTDYIRDTDDSCSDSEQSDHGSHRKRWN